ncbi:MAG: biotin carboxylase N-terminal domain-containing protein [Microthrixaceae bacterium]
MSDDTVITRLLVANRGEIARRVFRTCRDLGIATVAVHSDADAAMAFVAEADATVRLPGNSPAETYLRVDLIVDAALRTGVDAVHPGYGFLSENADFARAVVDAGLTWVGPDPESIETMGSKISAKALMAEAGVPVLGELTATTATEADLPLLVKASAGGGGRGMRVVRDLAALGAEIDAASSEAASAFGDGTVFVEPYVEHGRHVEVQVVGASDGVLVLGERDCSVQRRHQKVIEEAPAPGLSDATRAALHDAARAAAAAIDYRGAGTVEFLYDPGRDRFWFLEMNTRLQVEHPVTEAVLGIDLVALQIAVAEGRPLAELVVPEPSGHAVEVRLYAEDPAAGYRPQSGRLRRFEIDGVRSRFEGPDVAGIRLDSGVGAGDEISTFYDAMIAKVVAWAPTRDQALRRLAAALADAEIHGLRTNRNLLVNLLRDPVVRDGRMDTTWLDGADLSTLGRCVTSPDAVGLSAFAATIAVAEQARMQRPVQQRIASGYRNVVAEPLLAAFEDTDGEPVDVRWHGGATPCPADRDDVRVTGVELPVGSGQGDPVVVRLDVAGVTHTFRVHVDGRHVDVESALGHVALTRRPRLVDPAGLVAEGSLLAPMPGSVIDVRVGVGDHVSEGDTLVVMEAMKMQHAIAAPAAGVVVELGAEVGSQVDAGTVLAVVDADAAESLEPAHEGETP